MNNNSNAPLMPTATAIWLIENTSLTFKQIGDFCLMHELEVKGIADEKVAVGIVGISPVLTGQLEQSEIERCQKDPDAKLQIKINELFESTGLMKKNANSKAKYTPIARRQDKPDAIYWMLKNFPEIKDSTIVKLIGTTKKNIASIRDRSHWNIQNIRQRDPVLLGICTQGNFDAALKKAGLLDQNPPDLDNEQTENIEHRQELDDHKHGDDHEIEDSILSKDRIET